MPEMIAYFDAALHCQFANKAYLDWHAKTSEAVLGATLMDLLGSELFSISQAHVHAALAGESVQFERFLSKPDGSGAHLLVNYIAHADTDGAIIGFIVVATDIKALKIAEAELRLAATVVQNVSESIMVTDARGVIVSVNPAFTDINGYSMQEALGKTPRLLRSQHHPQQFYVDLWQQIVGVGLWRGEIWNRKKSGEVYLGWQTITRIAGPQPSDDRYISVSYDITEAWTSNERFKHQAFHDALTRLPNRLLLGERITRHIALAQRESRQLAVLFLDLDQFKAVNDLLGHAVGDEVLIVVAQKLKGLVRDADTVARLGGDEFVVLLDNPASEAHVELVARRIIEVLGQPMVFDSTHAHIGTSVGIAMYPDDGNSAAELIAQADLAMYAAKEAGRNTLRFAVRPRA
jgi:diguanylate cyclase (GGDEF)-like protein/PAS domain S-box-containing protein